MRLAPLMIAFMLACGSAIADDGEDSVADSPRRIRTQSLAKEGGEPEDTLSEEDKKLAQARKAVVVAATKRDIDDREKERRLEQKRRNLQRVKEINGDIAILKKQLAMQNRRSLAEYLDEAKEVLAEARREEARVLEKKALDEKVDAAIKKAGPLAIIRYGLVPNAINTPQVVVVLRNTTNQAIEAFEIEAECFDKFGDKVAFAGRSNVYRGISQTKIGVGREERFAWPLHLHDTTAVAKVWVSRIKLADGKELRQTKEEAEARGPAALVEAKLAE